MPVNDDSFKYLAGFLRRETGLAIDEKKMYLIRTRLLPLARKNSIQSLDVLVDEVRRNERGELAAQVIDQMTTNETLFFRDSYPFIVLKNTLFPELLKNRSRANPIKIWSAASSTGQEAFSIAMTAVNTIPQGETLVKILGTDLSSKSIVYAKEATYKQMEVKRGLPSEDLAKHFSHTEKNSWQAKDYLKAMVTFQEANLISPTLATSLRQYSPFDIVFCRNVLIYFDIEQRKKVIDEIAKLLAIGGYLFTGAGELVEGNQSKWETVSYENRPAWKLVSKF